MLEQMKEEIQNGTLKREKMNLLNQIRIRIKINNWTANLTKNKNDNQRRGAQVQSGKGKQNEKQKFSYVGQKDPTAALSTERCYHCGQLGHIFAKCPYHALNKATTPEELQLVEQEIQKARASVKGQGWRGALNRVETKINPEVLQSNKNQDESQKQDGKSKKSGSLFEVGRNACFRCGRSGHTSKECTYEDTRMCFVCGGVGHVAKQCPVSLKQKEDKKKMQQEKK
ncbi:MAG: hypothetical protein EZS28_018618 [Streblomastix strix]|uniref:CCHC-type domain-containing protein n=1 Tax=Streblomastix strix TaxID=222440 RepID=A0A5J4VUM0_9EUKA|nr:MAG: hypothetical protein EZS28_018618 [Streblomastix strix]